MKKILFLLIALTVALFMSCGGSEQAAAPAQQPAAQAAPAAPAFSVRDFVTGYIADLAGGNNIVSMDQFVADAIAGEDMYIVDIRRADDYNAGHIAGAVNMPWGSSAMWEAVPHIPTDRTVFVHCYTGQTAGQAIVLMQMAGIDAVSVNSGWNLGISRVEGYEAVVTTDATPLDTSFNNGVSDAVMTVIREYYQELATHVGTPFANRFVSEEGLKAIVDSGDTSVQIVSVRRPDDFAQGHIQGAVNVPFGAGMGDLIAGLPTDRRLAVYCYSGQMSNQAIALLNLLGYDAVSLIYGMGTPRTAPRGWTNNGFPTVTS